MEDQDIEESMDADASLPDSICKIQCDDLSNTDDSSNNDDSRNSVDSYFLSDNAMNDIWDHDDNENTDADSKLESSSLANLDFTGELIETAGNEKPQVVEIIDDEALEENNNDPNNNMDVIVLENEEEATATSQQNSDAERSVEKKIREVFYVDRADSPQPGCSKDSDHVFSLPSSLSESGKNNKVIKKTRQILSLLSKINGDSILDAVQINDKMPIEEFRLWDLLPEKERRKYLEFNSAQVKLNIDEISSESSEEASNFGDEIPTMQMEWNGTNNNTKRGPEDDICTIKPKKSSSDPNLSINSAEIKPNSAPRVRYPKNQGAIPKVRSEPLHRIRKSPVEELNDLFNEAQQSLPIEEFPLSRNLRDIEEDGKSETIEMINNVEVAKNSKSKRKMNKKKAQMAQTSTTVDVKLVPTVSAIKIPILKYPPKKSAPIKPNTMELKKSEPFVVGAAQSASAPVGVAAPINQFERTKTVSRPNQQAPKKAPVAAATAAPINQCKQTGTVNRPKQPAPTAGPVAAAAAAPIYQYIQTEAVNRPTQPAPTTAPITAAAAQIFYQYMPTEAVIRPKQPAPVAAAAAAPIYQYQYIQTEAVNRLKQPAPTAAPVAAAAAAPIYQYIQTEAVNRPKQPAPTTAPMQTPNYQQRQTATKNSQAHGQALRLSRSATPQQGRNQQTPASLNQQKEVEIVNLVPEPTVIPPQIYQQPVAAPMKETRTNEQTTKRPICEEMYWKLRNIFPNVDRKYIRDLCPPDWGNGDKDAQMEPIIEHLLNVGDRLPQETANNASMKQADNNLTYKSADDLYEFFIGIFPDADPHYLRDFAVKNIGCDESIKNFVDSNLQRGDYPTREQYMARLKITEQQKQYTTGFDIKEFLSIIPDPSKHFMDRERRCTYNTVALEFLKSHFNKLRVTTISAVYTQHGYNLSMAARSLEGLPDELKAKRFGSEMPTEDILLLQEIAFVKHKARIDDYIAQVAIREDEEFRTFKAMNVLLECQCCYDSECVPSKCSECDNGHIFCNSCIITGTTTKMGEDQTRINCFINCGSEFSLSTLQRVLAPSTFSILLKKRQAAEVSEAGLEGLVSCPFCHFASIPPEDDKVFKCLNPECTKESCRLCKELSHVPLKCHELQKTETARLYIEEKMTEALARKCYSCKRAFFKEEGCNKITCHCGAIMCYLCDQPISDYSHFRGQGSNAKTLCPLYSDTIRLDAVAVRKVAEEAKRELLKRNPNINIDTDKLLPNIPRAQRGPHNDVYDADELPRRVQRPLDLPPL